ncbi:hypothetical protein WMF39_09820 [Sorangium sp. So ce1504]|uniref:hypothetical protein n=1 Tax=Sorangium sp. So ce1504 TaxID=3133337 RepID=UPI003F64258C
MAAETFEALIPTQEPFMPTPYSMRLAGAAALSAAMLAGGCAPPSGISPAPAEPVESRSAAGAGDGVAPRDGKGASSAGREALADTSPAQSQALMDRTRKHAMVTAAFANTIAGFAAPRVIAKAKRLPSREEMLRCIDAYLEVVAETKRSPHDEGNQATINSEPYALKLRDLFSAWTPGATVPAAIQKNARAVLDALGIPEPPEGWDRFEGDAASSSP